MFLVSYNAPCKMKNHFKLQVIFQPFVSHGALTRLLK